MATLYPDISHYHPVTDWVKVKTNCPFLISKGTEGTSLIDSTLDDFISGCESNEIPYWLYAFLRKGSELEQAKFLVSTCASRVGSHFVGYILDVEKGNTAANVKSALDYLSGLGSKTMLYTMYSQYDTYKSVITARPSGCAFWEARYGQNNGSYSASYAPHSGADFHQYTSKGSCSGINGQIDLNRLTGTKSEDWFKTANGSTATTATETKTTSAASTTTASKTTSTTDTTKQIIKNGQTHANNFAGCGLTVDGVRGSATKKGGIKVLQTAMNLDYKSGLTVDGIWGTKSEKALGTHYVKKGETQYMVTALEILLMLKGHDTGGLENPGVFGTNLYNAVVKYQKANGLIADGIAGPKTFKSLIS
ncbi:MAG: peptidoglycan-binding protein [Lachnospiraceae bacterium]|nr:peptidoglycan-binding protein [Lachnospiraceae bacterium]